MITLITMGTNKFLFLLIFLFFTLAFTSSVFAQKGNSHISIGIEVGPSLNWQAADFPIQIGIPFKAYLGTGKNGQMMLRTGWHHFPNLARQIDPDVESLTRTAVPVALGYRHNIKKWYIEGSFGVAYDVILIRYKDSLKEPEGLVSMEPHYGLELGRRYNNIDIGLAIYNHGNIPFNIVFLGFKSVYKIRW